MELRITVQKIGNLSPPRGDAIYRDGASGLWIFACDSLLQPSPRPIIPRDGLTTSLLACRPENRSQVQARMQVKRL